MHVGRCAPRGAFVVSTIALALWVLGAISPPQARAQCPSFGSPTPVGAAAGTLAPADYDGDGTADLAIGDVVLFGDGAGGFGSPVTVLNVSALGAVDLGDRVPDLAAVSTSTPREAVVGQGTGIRGFPFTFLAGFPVLAVAPRAVAAADLNGDGIPDLAFAYGSPVDAIWIWIGTTTVPNWQFAVAPLQIPFTDPVALAVGDFSDDGRKELLALSGQANVLSELRFSQHWDLAQQNVTVSGGPTAMAVRDLDGDGFLDVVMTTGSGEVVSALGTGFIVTGAHLAPDPFGSLKRVSVGGRPIAIALGDVDGDRRTDAVVVDATGKQVVPLTGDGKGGFVPGSGLPASSPAPSSVMLADLDHDGALDLVTGDASDPHVVVRRNLCAGTAVDLQATGIEVTQQIQDLGNSVVLVADRPTFVRVHVKAGIPVDGVTARLERTDASGVPLERPLWPSNPGGVIDVRTTPDRADIAQSFWFELPPAWTAAGTLHLRATVNPDHLPGETSFTNDVVSASVTFQSTPALQIELIKTKVTIQPGSGTGCGQDAIPTDADLDLSESDLRRELPTGQLVITRQADVWDPGIQFPCELNAIQQFESSQVLAALKQAFASAPQDRIRLAIVKRELGGVAPLGASWFAVAQAGMEQTSPHEIGHTLGRFHTVSPAGFPCNPESDPEHKDPAYPYPSGLIGGPPSQPDRFAGFDQGDASRAFPILPRVVSPQTGDLMGYCRPTWSSDYTWTGNRNGIIAHPTAAADPAGDFLRITGMVDASGERVSGLAAVRLPSVGALPAASPGKWHLRLLGPDGARLADRSFAPAPTADGPGSLIDETLDFVPGTRSILVLDPRGNRSGSIAVSAHVPTVGKVTLSSGKSVPASGPVTVTWSSSDADGDALVADLLWSRDGGATFVPLATGVAGSKYTFDASRLAGTGGKASGVLRVLVRDPVLSALADLGGIAAPGSPPRIRILAPFPGQTFVRGQTVVLRAAAWDVEDGSLDPAVSWGSDRDGPLGGGANVAAQLSIGSHLLTARVVDSSGNVSTATTTVQVARVLPPGGPPVAFAGKAQGATLGSTVTLDGRGSSDPDGDPLLYSWRVTQLPAGLLGFTLSGKGPVATFVPEKGGTYGFELTVSDLRQGRSTDTVKVVVPNVPPTVTSVTPASGTVLSAGPVTVQARFTDPGLDTHTCTVLWDEDGKVAPVPGTVSEPDGTCTATGTLDAGVYSVRVSIRDDEGGEGVGRVQLVVVDPHAGAVSGHGRFPSPAGALVATPTLAGEARFELRSAYLHGAAHPTGEVELHLPGLHFRSGAQEWLVVSGRKAQVRGTGSVNGKSGFVFLATAYDDDPRERCEGDEDDHGDDRHRGRERHHASPSPRDRFRLKIWNPATGVLVYDDVRGAPDDIDSASPQPLSSGCIVVTHPGNHFPRRGDHDR